MPFNFTINEEEAQKSITIENTTKEQRKEIVKKGIAFANLRGSKSNDLSLYDDYIEGRRELSEIVDDLIRKELNEE